MQAWTKRKAIPALLLAAVHGRVDARPFGAGRGAVPVCLQIRSRIAQLDAAPSGGANARRFAAAAQRQRAELANATRTYRPPAAAASSRAASALRWMPAAGRCRRTSPSWRAGGRRRAWKPAQRAPAARPASRRLRRQWLPWRRRAREAAAPQRPGLFGLGAAPDREVYRDYRTEGRPQTAYREGAEPQRPGFGNFIEHLFGRSDPRPPPLLWRCRAIPEDQLRPGDGDDRPRNVGHRAVCVRLCDGAFFPMTSSPRRA